MQKRPSIKSIFSSWNKLTLVLLAILALLALTTLTENSSYNKSSNLFGQKSLINEIAGIGRDDLELAGIQYRGKSTQLQIEYEKLLAIASYDVLGMVLPYSNEYAQDLDTLKTHITAFNQAAEAWYDPSEKKLDERKQAMQAARYGLLSHIDILLFKNIGYDMERYAVQKWLIYAAAGFGLLIFALFTLRFRTIYKDISSISTVETKGSEYQIVTDEIDVISKRMSRKGSADVSENPAMMDPVTEISNYKGLLHTFANGKQKDASNLAVCVFDIDDFKDLDREYPKSFTQMVLKKISFMLSLYVQQTDILARTDYSQFTLVLSRNNLEEARKECERIRQSVEETAFKVPKGTSIRITISGGLSPKTSNASLEETIEMSRDILLKGRAMGKNSIKQAKDVVQA